MLKKIVAASVLALGLSWAVPASADVGADTKADTQIEADADVKAILDAFPGATVRTYDLTKKNDLCSLLSMLFGLDTPVDATVDTDAKVTVGG